MVELALHPDRLLPADPTTRSIARELYDLVRDAPILSPHGHVPAALLAQDQPFPDPAALFVTPDHYVTRLLHAQGPELAELGVRPAPGQAPAPRAIWRRLCEGWHLFRGTPSRLYLVQDVLEVFGLRLQPSSQTADELYDELSARLATPEFRPRALFRHFGIEVLATTDSPLDDLTDHAALAQDRSWSGRVIPTFRPDALLSVDTVGWGDSVARLGELTGCDTGSYGGYLEALQARREHFRRLGATATDHGHPTADSTPLERADAEAVYDRALRGALEPGDAAAFRASMLTEMARMSCEDGLVMQLHPGVLRGHHGEALRRYGPDTGSDIPTATEYTRSLRPLLERHGDDPRFGLVLFTVDETVFSRELAPLAGYYRAVRLGAPWWFLDAPGAMLRFREAVTETAGFYRTAGFIDDTRAFCSIPARHDVARRVDAGYLAKLVAEHRMPMQEAAATAVDLVTTIPRTAFRL